MYWHCRPHSTRSRIYATERCPSVRLSYCPSVCPFATGNESVPKIIINDTVFFKTTIGILVISNRNSFRALFDKIASVYFIWKIYLYFSIGSGQSREPALCQLYRHTFVPYSGGASLSRAAVARAAARRSAANAGSGVFTAEGRGWTETCYNEQSICTQLRRVLTMYLRTM